MSNSIGQRLKAVFRGVETSMTQDDHLLIASQPDNVPHILRFLIDEGYIHLALISCVDWIDKDKLELVYVLSSYFESEHLILKTEVPRKDPKIKTVIGVFENAEPYEREIHELFGVNFEGHPRQTALFLEREYKIPPFRKDFDTRKYVKEVFDEIPFVEEDR